MLSEKDNDFFQLHTKEDICDLSIHNNYLYFEQLKQILDLRETASHRTFRITGRSSVEAYFCLGFLLTHWQASMLIGIGADGEEQLRIDLREPAAAKQKKWLTCDIEHGVAEMRSDDTKVTGEWTAGDLELAIPTALPASKRKSLHITGRGSVWMYMHLGASAALAGVRDVFLSKPQLPYEIHISSDGHCEPSVITAGSKQGVIIGILGDPNSGKSVFSRNFARAIPRTMPSWFTTWIYDCDLASPTPEWYLQDREGTSEQRKRIKRPWTPELERKAAADLKNLRRSLDLVLADMPGGKPCGQDLDRIPSATRGEMMAQCDAFIILCRKDRAEEIFRAWHQALEKYHLADRIVARFISSDPEAPFAISPLKVNGGGLFCASISGLDRDKDRAEIVRVMSEGLCPLIRHLSYVRVAREALKACTLSSEEHGIGFGTAVRNAGNGQIYSAGERSSSESTCIGTQCIEDALARGAETDKAGIDVLALACSQPEKLVFCDEYRRIVGQHMRDLSPEFKVILAEDPLHIRELAEEEKQ